MTGTSVTGYFIAALGVGADDYVTRPLLLLFAFRARDDETDGHPRAGTGQTHQPRQHARGRRRPAAHTERAGAAHQRHIIAYAQVSNVAAASSEVAAGERPPPPPSLYFVSRYNIKMGGGVSAHVPFKVRPNPSFAKGCRRESRRVRLRRGAGVEPPG